VRYKYIDNQISRSEHLKEGNLSDEYQLKRQVLALIQEDNEISAAVAAAVRAKKNDWLTNLVKTIAAAMEIVNDVINIVQTVVNWLSPFN